MPNWAEQFLSGNADSEKENGKTDRRIIVSIDFGTTYSGIAWAETSRVSYNLVLK